MSPNDKVNILLVDDQPQKLLSYEVILGPLDENLLHASSARGALEILLRQDIAVILVDVVMPEMDGFEFARIVREHPRFTNVPMIFVTAISTSNEELVQGYALGAVDYVCVPVVPEILRAKVAVFIDLHRKTHALLSLNRTLEDRIKARTLEAVQAMQVAENNARRLEQEILERRQAVETLRQRAEELETLLETLPIGVFIAHDSECQRITGNQIAHEMLRMPTDADLSQSALAIERPSHCQICRNGVAIPIQELPVQLAARGNPVRSAELEHVFPDGTVLYSLVSATPLFDDKGQSRGSVATVVDITSRKLAEQAFVEADRRKDEFLATLAHELRNPLAPLANSLELMNVAALDSAEFAQLREIMDRQVSQLRRLVDDLLDVARITRNKIELHQCPIDLWSIVLCALESCRPLIEGAGHALLLYEPKQPICVNADRIRLTQVVSNLLSNAANYTERGGKIWVSCERVNGHAEIRVKDSGIGIPSNKLHAIFELFTRADSSLARARDGLGVGLTLVKKLVELHGGSVEATSAGPGSGSEFTVRLSVSDGETAADEAVLSSSDDELPRFRVLVVDDMRSSALLVSRMLSALQQDVTTAHDGTAALAAIDCQVPDLVISDIGMPQMDGYELARRIRARADCHSIHLVALTGYGQEQDRSRAYDAGFDDHLVKPVSLSNLRGVLRLLQQKQGSPSKY